jgi:hypothetical protein
MYDDWSEARALFFAQLLFVLTLERYLIKKMRLFGNSFLKHWSQGMLIRTLE